MTFSPSRRGLLLGAAGAATLAACKGQAEQVGAFPSLPDHGLRIGPQEGTARLHSNENPYGPAPSAKKMIDYAALKGAYYADDRLETLTSLIAERHGLTPDHVTLSTGSAEALCSIALIYGQKGPIIAPRLFFDATPLYAQNLGLATIERAAMGADMSVDLTAIEAMVTPNAGLVQLCNPNNPTGMLSDAATLKAVVRRMAKIAPVCVDEAYMELTDDPEGNTCIGLIKEGHDVMVSRTFSKVYGMAGLRVGYILSSPETAQIIRKGVMTWMAGTGLAAAVGCYDDLAFVAYSKAKIIEGRAMVLDTLKTLGMEALPSQTNFVYFKSGIPANDLRQALADQGILIRGQYMDYDAYSRVSMGKLEDVERFCKALPQVVGA